MLLICLQYSPIMLSWFPFEALLTPLAIISGYSLTSAFHTHSPNIAFTVKQWQHCIVNVTNVGMQLTKGAAFHIKLSAFCGWRRYNSFPVFIMTFFHMLQIVNDHCSSISTNAQQIINHGAQPGSCKLRSWQSTQLSDHGPVQVAAAVAAPAAKKARD